MDEDLYIEGDSTDHFEMGDGADVVCPCCGETVMIVLDPGGGVSQEYVEDCQVCCRPWKVRVRYDGLGVPTVGLEPD